MNQPQIFIFVCTLLLSAICRSGHADQLEPDFGLSATFSIVAVDPETGVCGAAVASKYPSVGKVVPYVRQGVGAFCTQHWHNPPWGEKALDLLAAGHGPEEVLGILLANDERRDKRQLAIIDMQGRAANRNPSNADPSGVYWGAMSGRFYACQGNTLTGREVIVAMAEAYEETEGSLADRLMAALVAADCAGGDHRGRLAAGIRVAKSGYEGHWFELYVDESDDAVMDLFKKYVDIEHAAKGNWIHESFKHPCLELQVAQQPQARHPSVSIASESPSTQPSQDQKCDSHYQVHSAAGRTPCRIRVRCTTRRRDRR